MIGEPPPATRHATNAGHQTTEQETVSHQRGEAQDVEETSSSVATSRLPIACLASGGCRKTRLGRDGPGPIKLPPRTVAVRSCHPSINLR